FKVIRRVGNFAFELELPLNIKAIHLIISIVYLKLTFRKENPFGRIPPPPGLVEDS
ncbi:uncharacterized protein B0T23DRAFT_315545, partial [Neurospora hispaniola]